MAQILSPELFFEKISGTLSSKKQLSHNFIDLTIHAVFRNKAAGKLDFGGSEFSPGLTDPCFPVKNHPDEPYGWWNLHDGYYQIIYNEEFKLAKNEIAFLQPHPRLLSAGSFHPSLLVNELNRSFHMLLHVPKHGIQLKENARISQILVIDF
ncbi:MAG: hypothetical protein EH225_04970 [Calditrichaeota bacterium]|nr:hypothetical protein [Calditrichota bacterium]RQW05068.1 MAG: hypothetical protein EH225_04970 [Calditrichota bacterium]